MDKNELLSKHNNSISCNYIKQSGAGDSVANNKFEKRKWKKLLYEKQYLPDNYTDEEFLQELRKNTYIRIVTFKEAFIAAGMLTQQICFTVYFGCCFFYLYNYWITPAQLLFYSGALCIIIYVILFAIDCNVKEVIFSCVFCSVITYLLSPVLKSLTETISTDTVFSSSIALMCAHLIFYDYGVPVFFVSYSIALNAAVFAAVFLVSRLDSCFHVFTLITICVMLFALGPLFTTKINHIHYSPCIFVVLSTIALYFIDFNLTILFVCVIIFVNLICPYYFVKWYTYKNNLNGPWDEATVNRKA